MLRLHQIIAGSGGIRWAQQAAAAFAEAAAREFDSLGFRGCARQSRPGLAPCLRGLPRKYGTYTMSEVSPPTFEYRQGGTAMPAVREWLVSLGLSEYADSFAEDRIGIFRCFRT